MIKTIQVEEPDYTYKKGNKKLNIYQEQEPINPREYDNIGIMLCTHRRYNLGDEQIKSEDFKGWEEIEDYLFKEKKAVVVLPLYLYDHSGITINTTGFSCPWDSGQVGFIYTTKEKIKEIGLEYKDLEDIKKQLIGEVETYDKYLTGEIYRYVLYDKGEEIDSCGGFYEIDYILTETKMKDAKEEI